MAIKFTAPTKTADTVAAVQSVLRATCLMIAEQPLSAIAELPDVWKALRGTNSHAPENLAWVWHSMTLARATADFLTVLHRDALDRASSVNFDQFEEASTEFLGNATPPPDSAQFDVLALQSPASHAAFAKAREGLVPLILASTSITKFDEKTKQRDTLLREFDNCLNRASVHVFSSEYDRLKTLEDYITGTAAEPMRREATWTRHADWVQRKFSTDHVFSLDDSVTAPLSQLYLRLRCYWHEELPTPPENETRRFRPHLADLHGTANDWLQSDHKDTLRLIAGGPGSGKSSFAKAFSSEVIDAQTHRVIFFELQRMTFRGDLRTDIETYLQERHKKAGDIGSPAMPQDVLEWVKEDTRPTLLVFDGLDELTFDDAQAAEVTRKYILKVKTFVDGQTGDGTRMKALVLGRNAAIQEGMHEMGLPRHMLLNVAPIRGIESDDLKFESVGPARSKVEDLDLSALEEALTKDQRPGYWKKWALVKQLADCDQPEAVTHEDLKDLNVEPLLLHLLIISGYCDDANW
ncbi:MAG: NACHT domain-containing protein, partial [Pseudomonadota bacterium]